MTDATEITAQREQELQKQQAEQWQKPGLAGRQMPQPGIPSDWVTQTTSTSAGPFAHIDQEAQDEVQKELNLRVARDSSIPFTPPEVPPGLSPNEIVQWASGHGTVGGGLIAGPLQPGGEVTLPPPIDTPPEGSDPQQRDKSQNEE